MKNSKVMVFEEDKHDVIGCGNLYRVKTQCEKLCKIKLNGCMMEEVNESK